MRNLFVYLFLFFLLTFCVGNKLHKREEVIGEYSYKNKTIYLKINQDSSFCFLDKRSNRGCIGKWSIDGTKINLNCQSPPHIGYLIQNFNYVEDSIFNCKIEKEKIIFDKLKLKKE